MHRGQGHGRDGWAAARRADTKVLRWGKERSSATGVSSKSLEGREEVAGRTQRPPQTEASTCEGGRAASRGPCGPDTKTWSAPRHLHEAHKQDSTPGMTSPNGGRQGHRSSVFCTPAPWSWVRAVNSLHSLVYNLPLFVDSWPLSESEMDVTRLQHVVDRGSGKHPDDWQLLDR